MLKTYYFKEQEVNDIEKELDNLNSISKDKISESKFIRYLIHLGITNFKMMNQEEGLIDLTKYANESSKDSISKLVDELFTV